MSNKTAVATHAHNVRERWGGLLTADEVCEYLSCSKDKLYQLRARGILKPVDGLGERLPRFRRWEIDQWIDQMQYGDFKFGKDKS